MVAPPRPIAYFHWCTTTGGSMVVNVQRKGLAAYMTSNQAVRQRIPPCRRARGPFAVALRALAGAAISVRAAVHTPAACAPGGLAVGV